MSNITFSSASWHGICLTHESSSELLWLSEVLQCLLSPIAKIFCIVDDSELHHAFRDVVWVHLSHSWLCTLSIAEDGGGCASKWWALFDWIMLILFCIHVADHSRMLYGLCCSYHENIVMYYYYYRYSALGPVLGRDQSSVSRLV